MNNKKSMHADVETMVQQFGLAAHIAVVMIETGELSFDVWVEEVTKAANSK